MGCHMWLYKKATALSYDTMKTLLDYEKDLWSNQPITETREEFINNYVTENIEILNELNELGFSHNDPQYQMALIFSNPVEVNAWYDSLIDRYKLCTEAYNKFIDNPTYENFLNAYKVYVGDNSAAMDIHNGEIYIKIIFDTYFRCYEYGDGPDHIDNYEDMIKYLEVCPSTMIRQYGTFDEYGKFHYYNDKTYEYKNGLTDELKDMLKFLYKDNDIFIVFG